MSWADRASNIKVGDRNAVSARFLRSIGCFTGDLAQARGTVKELTRIGEVTVAVVDWGLFEVEAKVNVSNLSRISARGIMDVD